jgi:23S rRNA pseudouridine2605 synthase
MRPGDVRIQKALADAGVASRRAADALVAAGRVTVNGVPAEIGQRVSPGTDQLAVDGRIVGARPRQVYLALHKPAGVTSTVADRHAERTVIDLVPRELRAQVGRVYPVGRLDRDSEGLLLLTNDGDWAQRVLHPSHGVEREYAAGVREPLVPEQVSGLLGGVALEEGIARVVSIRRQTDTETRRLVAPAAGRALPSGRLVWYRVVLTQGWKRQVRRMFAETGSLVERLVRVRIGSVRLADLPPGDLRELSAQERDRLASDLRPGSASEAIGAAGRPRGATRRPLTVAIDGPGSSGKSTVGAGAAARLGYRFCDTGVLYRGLAKVAADRGVDPTDAPGLVRLVPALELADDGAGRISLLLVDGVDVTGSLHAADVDRVVSAVARVPEVRGALLRMQRDIVCAHGDRGLIMAGRDIGSVVLPDADLKLYLDVSLEERARRRATQRGLKPGSAEARHLLEELRRRDIADSSRETSPLVVPDDAVTINTDGRSLERSITEVVAIIRAAEAAG